MTTQSPLCGGTRQRAHDAIGGLCPDRRSSGLGALMCAAAAVVLSLAIMPRAHAQAQADQAACTFFEIKASNAEPGIDSQLKTLARKLSKPPFSSWKTFKLVKRHDKKLERMKAEDIRLADGSKLQALYHQRSGGTKARFSLSVTLDDKNGRRALDTKISVDAGDYFLIAMSTGSESSDILALTCNSK